MCDCVLFDLRSPLAQLFPLRQTVGALVTLRPDEPEGLVMPMSVSVVGDELVGSGGVVLGFHARNLQAIQATRLCRWTKFERRCLTRCVHRRSRWLLFLVGDGEAEG